MLPLLSTVCNESCNVVDSGHLDEEGKQAFVCRIRVLRFESTKFTSLNIFCTGLCNALKTFILPNKAIVLSTF